MRKTIIEIRDSKLPLLDIYPNAGSFFKNPVISREKLLNLKEKYDNIVYFDIDKENVKVPAGWLIENCDLKGKREGNVGTFENQALIIINYGVKTGKEILDFSQMVQQRVFNKFGIEILPEVNII